MTILQPNTAPALPRRSRGGGWKPMPIRPGRLRCGLRAGPAKQDCRLLAPQARNFGR